MKRAFRLFVTLFAMTTVLAVPTGTVARQTSTTDSETVTLVLPEEPCSVNIHHEDGDFGSWEWDSSLGWVRTTRDSTMTFWVMLSADTYNGCDVTVSFDGLKGTGETIGPGSFSTTFSGIAQAQTSLHRVWSDDGRLQPGLHPRFHPGSRSSGNVYGCDPGVCHQHGVARMHSHR